MQFSNDIKQTECLQIDFIFVFFLAFQVVLSRSTCYFITARSRNLRGIILGADIAGKALIWRQDSWVEDFSLFLINIANNNLGQVNLTKHKFSYL